MHVEEEGAFVYLPRVYLGIKTFRRVLYVGSFPGDECFCVWRTLGTLSRLTKQIIVTSSVACMAHALTIPNYHELKRLVSNNGVGAGQRGWIGSPSEKDKLISSC